MQQQSEFEALSPAPSKTTRAKKTNAVYKAKNLENRRTDGRAMPARRSHQQEGGPGG